MAFLFHMKKFYNENQLVFKEKPTRGDFKDRTGLKYGRLTVIGFAGQNGRNNGHWYCRCECSKVTMVQGCHLQDGRTTSCGCFHMEKVIECNTTHGHNKKGRVSPTYCSWGSMLERCQNPKNNRFNDYGARGITVCKRWLKFENFLADMGERPKGKTLDRKKNDLGYFKDNCRWATLTEQNNNTRRNVFLTFEGKTQTITQWAREKGINNGTLRSRIVLQGWSIERALSLPAISRNFKPKQNEF